MSTLRKTNWIRIAVTRMGGPIAAARQLHVTEQTFYYWFRCGCRGAQAVLVWRMSELSGISVERLFDWPVGAPPLAREAHHRLTNGNRHAQRPPVLPAGQAPLFEESA